ncbi:MAG: serine/threonine-protein kinase [Candidatus Zixiibacteriota bacterium]
MVKKFSGLILYFLITILVISLYGGKYGFLEKLDSKIQDGMFGLRGTTDVPPANIVIVGIDDRSLDQGGRWPWHGDMLAGLTHAISQGSPKVIGLDIFLPEETGQDTSQQSEHFASEVRAAGNVILPIYFNLSDVGIAPPETPEAIVRSAIGSKRDLGQVGSSFVSAKQIYCPNRSLTEASAAFGHINIDYDQDGLVRGEPLLINYDGYLYPSFGLQLATRYLQTDRGRITPERDGGLRIGKTRISTDGSRRMSLNYLGPNLTFKRVSAMEVLNGEIDPKMFAQKIVLVGLTAAGSKTWVQIPSFGEINEVERIATVTENIIHHDFLRHLSALWSLLILICIGVFCALVLPKVSLAYRLTILLVFLFVIVNFTYILFSSLGIVTQPIYPIVELLFFMIAAPSVKPKLEPRKEKEGDISESAKADLTQPQTEKATSQTPQRIATSVTQTVIPEPVSSAKEAGLGNAGHPGSDHAGEIGSESPGREDPGRFAASTYGAPADLTIALSKTPVSPTPLETRLASFSSEGAPSVAQFGRYKIIQLLGKGGMGTVYKGLDPALDRPVALKTIRLDFALSADEKSELRERLIREAKAAGQLSHPNIVTIYDVGEEGGLHYIAMEYLSGYTLEEFIERKGEINYRIMAKIIMQTCDALSYAHQHGIVHRDIKPANIMLLEDFHAKVMDFGIARLQTTSLTQSNVAMGTPYYISPEQIEGKPADKRSDIFSLGVLIYELLTYEKPFLAENISSLMYRILNHNPVPPSTINDKTPLIFDRIVAKAMAKNPDERYKDASEISKILREFVASFVVTRSVRI